MKTELILKVPQQLRTWCRKMIYNKRQRVKKETDYWGKVTNSEPTSNSTICWLIFIHYKAWIKWHWQDWKCCIQGPVRKLSTDLLPVKKKKKREKVGLKVLCMFFKQFFNIKISILILLALSLYFRLNYITTLHIKSVVLHGNLH